MHGSGRSGRFHAGLAVLTVLGLLATTGPVLAGSGKAWLGVMLQSDGEEVKLVRVVPDSPADKAGLKAGDVLLKLDGRPPDLERLGALLKDHDPGAELGLGIRREGKELELRVKLGERKQAAARHAYSLALQLDQDDDPGHAENVFVLSPGTPRVRLGVSIQALSDQLRNYFRVPSGQGVLVSEIHEGSPAEAAGVEAGDVIVAVNDATVSSRASLLDALKELKPDEKAQLGLVRQRKPVTVEVTVEERPAAHWVWPGGHHGDALRLYFEHDPADREAKLHEALEQLRHSQRAKGRGYEKLLEREDEILEQLRRTLKHGPGLVEIRQGDSGVKVRVIRQAGPGSAGPVVVGEPALVDLERVLVSTLDDGI